jgi:hypothetical protein
VLPNGLLLVFLPLILFVVDALGTLAWYRPAMDGLQLLVVCTSFLCVMMLCARESFADPLLAGRLRMLLVVTAVFPVFTWAALLLLHIVATEDTNLTRGFALYTLPVIAAALATWRGYFWPDRGGAPQPKFGSIAHLKSFWPLLWVLIIGYVVMLGLSRTALVIVAMMVPLALIYRGSLKDVLKGVAMLFIGGVCLWALVENNEALKQRFFGEDQTKVAGIGLSVNAEGRGKIWSLLLDDLRDDWFIGKGVASSEAILNRAFGGMISQPHNDYLRFYYDQGVVGESLWLLFIVGFVVHTIGNLRRSVRYQTPDYVQHLAALLALTGISLSMTTDNSYCYEFVMFPLAMMMGCSMGLGRYYARYKTAPPAVQDDYIAPPMMGVVARHSR